MTNCVCVTDRDIQESCVGDEARWSWFYIIIVSHKCCGHKRQNESRVGLHVIKNNEQKGMMKSHCRCCELKWCKD